MATCKSCTSYSDNAAHSGMHTHTRHAGSDNGRLATRTSGCTNCNTARSNSQNCIQPFLFDWASGQPRAGECIPCEACLPASNDPQIMPFMSDSDNSIFSYRSATARMYGGQSIYYYDGIQWGRRYIRPMQA